MPAARRPSSPPASPITRIDVVTLADVITRIDVRTETGGSRHAPDRGRIPDAGPSSRQRLGLRDHAGA